MVTVTSEFLILFCICTFPTAQPCLLSLCNWFFVLTVGFLYVAMSSYRHPMLFITWSMCLLDRLFATKVYIYIYFFASLCQHGFFCMCSLSWKYFWNLCMASKILHYLFSYLSCISSGHCCVCNHSWICVQVVLILEDPQLTVCSTLLLRYLANNTNCKVPALISY